MREEAAPATQECKPSYEERDLNETIEQSTYISLHAQLTL